MDWIKIGRSFCEHGSEVFGSIRSEEFIYCPHFSRTMLHGVGQFVTFTVVTARLEMLLFCNLQYYYPVILTVRNLNFPNTLVEFGFASWVYHRPILLLEDGVSNLTPGPIAQACN
jgi:hypothetical protein